MLAGLHARTYFLIINHAFHCARTDERSPSWVSELLTPQKLAHAPLKTLEFQDSVLTGAPVQNLKIVGARINPGSGGWERKFVFDVQREDGGVGEWPSYDLAVSLKLIDPRSEPPSAPNRGGTRDTGRRRSSPGPLSGSGARDRCHRRHRPSSGAGYAATPITSTLQVTVISQWRAASRAAPTPTPTLP